MSAYGGGGEKNWGGDKRRKRRIEGTWPGVRAAVEWVFLENKRGNFWAGVYGHDGTVRRTAAAAGEKKKTKKVREKRKTKESLLVF